MHILDLSELLRKNPLFSALQDDELSALSKEFVVQVYGIGDAVVRKGEPGDAFYVIYSGKARVVDQTAAGQQVTLAVLNKGDTFGEKSLLHRTARTSTVRASGDLVVLKLSMNAFEDFLGRHSNLRFELEDSIRQRTEYNFLRRLGLLSHLKLPELQALAKQIQRVYVRAGQTLFTEGDAGDRAYIVRDGELEVFKRSGSSQRKLATTRPGDLIGEMSLLHGQARSATVVAVSDSVLLCLRPEDFNRVTSDAEKRDIVIQQASNRLLQTETFLSETDHESEPAAARAFHVRRVQVGAGLLARHYPFLSVDSPMLSGLACLSMACAHTGRPPIPAADFERKLREAKPDTLLTISNPADAVGFLTRSMHIGPRQLRRAVFPAMVQLGDRLVLLYGATRTEVTVADPLTGVYVFPLADFARDWDGQVLSLASVPTLSPSRKNLASIYRQYLPFAAPYFSLIGWLVAVTIVIALLGLASPFFSKVIVDKVLVSGDWQLLYLLLLGMLMVTAFQLAASSLRQYLVVHVMRRISLSLQLRMFHHILALPQKIVSRWQTGDFLIRFAENEKVLELVSQTGFQVVVDCSLILIYVAVLFMTNAKLAAIGLVFVFGYAALMAFSSPRLRAINREVFQARKESESHFIEVVGGMQTIKSLATESHMFERGRALLTPMKTKEFREAFLSFTINLIGSGLQQAATILVLGYGAMLALQKKITPGELIAFNALLASTLAPMLSLLKVWDQLQELRVSFERVTDVLSLEPETNARNAATPVIQGHVVLKNVFFRYPDSARDVFIDLNLEVLPGQKIALVGRSGAGKTSLANLLVNLYEPTQGSILIDNVDITSIHKNSLRRQVGIVEQQPFLFSGTIRENIAKADPAAGLDTIIAAANLAGAHEFIEELPLGYDTQVGERGTGLSGGQKQRIVIARTILNNPRILILDEATSALDTESERTIQRNLEQILAGKTAFIIAHRLSTVRNADKIVVLDDGRIAEMGTHEELMGRRGLYSYLSGATTA